MQIQKATEQSRNGIASLLQDNKLPSEDLPANLDDFYVALEQDRLIGVIGMERYSTYGLLRSMVVHVEFRNKQIAEALVNKLEDKAKKAGIKAMYLLTETAKDYFNRKGYSVISRDDVPTEIKASSQFSHVCPVSAIIMKKQLQERL